MANESFRRNEIYKDTYVRDSNTHQIQFKGVDHMQQQQHQEQQLIWSVYLDCSMVVYCETFSCMFDFYYMYT